MHRMIAAVIAGVCGAALPAIAAPQVPSYERFHADPKADRAELGRLLIGELNCLSCHDTHDHVKREVLSRRAPNLEGVGTRLRPEWYRDSLFSAEGRKPGTVMPDLLHGLAPAERATMEEALSAFLASTGSPAETFPDAALAGKGEQLFHSVGCVACHDPAGKTLATSVPLGDLTKKYTVASLQDFLKEPHRARPSGRMPAFGNQLNDEEYRAIANYLLKGVSISPNVKFTAFHGHWDELPNFAELRGVKSGECAGFDLTVAGRPNDFAVRFEGTLRIRKSGRYTLHLGSDDGSRLMIDGAEKISVDGIHPYQEESWTGQLDAGRYPLVIEYFQGGGEWTLRADIEGSGISRSPLAAFVSLSADAQVDSPDEPRVKPELVDAGRQAFGTLGCAACHEMKVDGQAIARPKRAKSLVDANMSAGCLSTTSMKGVPNFELTDGQRAAIQAALSAKEAPVASPNDQIHRQFMAFNCYACHARIDHRPAVAGNAANSKPDDEDDDPAPVKPLGGVEDERNDQFKSAYPEMGDEGRLPPSLTGVGDKLREEYLKHILNQGADDRKNYMRTRMPRFGEGNLPELVKLLAEADRKESAPEPRPFEDPEYRIKTHGRHLVGGKAASCIKCHDFGKHPSTGIRAMSLTKMTQRLREDWFRRYLPNPQVYRPGTRMPSAWPFGQASIRDVLDGDADWQIRAVWTYLADGEKAAIPVGLLREPIELKADARPVLYRNFIEGAGSRAIGVGYPEGVNLAWDANQMRPAMVWRGPFIDASRHWSGRGEGFEGPLGDDVIPQVDGPAWAELATNDAAWPGGSAREGGHRFRGYRLDSSGRPIFQHELGRATIEETYQPLVLGTSQSTGLARTVVVTGSAGTKPLSLRLAAGGKLEPMGEGKFLIDGIWTMETSTKTPAILRESGGRKELLLPIDLSGGRAEATIRYLW